ncbi:PilW family protein [Thalassotalea sp. G2M2-11]|uniref:PilW family protein n=1 Tax=Thalassotalea sp. G2M2-11 TaxID=2787627 RepID=UPI0019D2EC05|nr:PilW family protein [Thalassotalea sp. G2M2-11]
MKKQLGFTILEIFIALTIGLVLFAGVMSIFVGMKTTTKETSSYGELQENGRFALSVLTEDLLRQDFWGDLTGTLDLAKLNGVPVAPGNDCNGGGVNNASFPAAVGRYRTIWGATATAQANMGCIADAKIGSDILQLKRVISTPLESAPGIPIANAPSGKYYFVANQNEGEIFAGGGAVPDLDVSRVWEFQHHVYYVREDTIGSNTVPVLMQGQLTTKMNFEPIIDGIERIKFMYGVDTNFNGVVNTFISANNMTQNLWDGFNNARILAVKVYVLARNVQPDPKYTDTKTYQMGDELVPAFNDNYRRLLFTSVVSLHNAGIEEWPKT